MGPLCTTAATAPHPPSVTRAGAPAYAALHWFMTAGGVFTGHPAETESRLVEAHARRNFTGQAVPWQAG